MGRNAEALRPALLLCVYPFGGSAVTFTAPQSLDEERRCLTAIKHCDRAAFLRPYQLALLATIVLGAGCASSMPPETAQPTPSAPRSAATPADLQEVEVIREVVDGQSRTLEAEQSQAEPDCTRVRLLARNICTLAEHICKIAARYAAAGDPIGDSCSDAKRRCGRAEEIVQQRCTLPNE